MKNFQKIEKFLKEYDFSKVILTSPKPGCIKYNRKLWKKFQQKYNFSLPIKDFLYISKNYMKLTPENFFCKECGNRTHLRNYSYGFTKFCSKSCANKSQETKEVTRKNCLKNYGVDSPNKLESKKIKTKKTNLERYGCTNPSQNEKVKEKIRQTNLKRYGCASSLQNEKVKEKIRQTNLEKYGCINPIQNEKVKEKIRQTNLEKYGVESTNSLLEKKIKIANTNLEKYGNKCSLNNPEIREKAYKTCNKHYGVNVSFASKEIQTKIKQTMLQKYGVTNVFFTPYFQQLLLNKYGDSLPDKQKEWKLKAINTFCKNNSYKTSKDEKILYQLLKKYFPKVKRQYYDTRYPFKCDFYIPCSDLFIELNAHWTHEKEPFDALNPRHQEVLSKWQEKKSYFYDIAIQVWTERDPIKLLVAEINNLKYFYFYSLQEAKNWLKTLKPKSYYHNMTFSNKNLTNIWNDYSIRNKIIKDCSKKYNTYLGKLTKLQIFNGLYHEYLRNSFN